MAADSASSYDNRDDDDASSSSSATRRTTTTTGDVGGQYDRRRQRPRHPRLPDDDNGNGGGDGDSSSESTCTRQQEATTTTTTSSTAANAFSGGAAAVSAALFDRPIRWLVTAALGLPSECVPSSERTTVVVASYGLLLSLSFLLLFCAVAVPWRRRRLRLRRRLRNANRRTTARRRDRFSSAANKGDRDRVVRYLEDRIEPCGGGAGSDDDEFEDEEEFEEDEDDRRFSQQQQRRGGRLSSVAAAADADDNRHQKRKEVRIFMDGAFDMLHFGHMVRRRSRSLYFFFKKKSFRHIRPFLLSPPFLLVPLTLPAAISLFLSLVRTHGVIFPFGRMFDRTPRLQFTVRTLTITTTAAAAQKSQNAFRLARSLGTRLVVGVNSDESITECKGAPLMNDSERITMVKACRFVDEVVPDCPYVMNREYIDFVIDKYKIDYVVHGDDPCFVDGRDVYEAAKQAGKFQTIPRTEGVSTTDIVGRMLLMSKEHHLLTDHSFDDDGDDDVDGEDDFNDAVADEEDRDDDGIDIRNHQHPGSPKRTSSDVSTIKECLVGYRQSKFLTTSRMLQLFSAGVKAPREDDHIVYIDGAWDLFHPGHVSILKAAREVS